MGVNYILLSPWRQAYFAVRYTIQQGGPYFYCTIQSWKERGGKQLVISSVQAQHYACISECRRILKHSQFGNAAS